MRASSASEAPVSHKPFSRRGAVLSWAAVLAWAVVIFFMSSNTGDELSGGRGLVSQVFQLINNTVSQIFGIDADLASPVGHFCEYAVFGALLANALRGRLPLRGACVLAVVVASAYGVTDEFHQWFVPGRASDPADWAVDTVAAAIGSIVVGWRCRVSLCQGAKRGSEA